MRKLTATICLTISVLLGGAGGLYASDYEIAGKAYERGDYKTALEHYRALALSGHAQAQYDLGVIDLTGKGLEPQKDPSQVLKVMNRGIELITLSAKQENPDALGMLAGFHERGFAQFPKDLRKAYSLRQKAASTGDGVALYNLATAIMQGTGTPPNPALAARLFEQAASQNMQAAMFNLGILLLKNPQLRDLSKSYMWFYLSKEWRPDSAGPKHMLGRLQSVKLKSEKALWELATKMTPSQLEKAQDLARECVRKKYKGC
jgi:TPR repeat protein